MQQPSRDKLTKYIIGINTTNEIIMLGALKASHLLLVLAVHAQLALWTRR
jgi:hypothetical protein